jgi:hypothetical protein
VSEEGLGAFKRRRKHAERGAHRRLLWRPRRGSAFTREEKGGKAFIASMRRLGCFLALQGDVRTHDGPVA